MGVRILLAVSGLSPQVVTETLFALTQKQDPPFVPHKVILLTTREGAARARLGLLTGEDAYFYKFCRDYNLPNIQFDEQSIRVIKDSRGRPLTDIRTPSDNSDVADFICKTIRELTSDPDTQLHVSIAGGRKTMGYYAGYALSLFGRPQDQLSHVLVSEHYESNSKFWYPTPYHQVIYSTDNKPLDTAEAEVHLAQIPFVRLREFLPDDTVLEHRTFKEIVEQLQQVAERNLVLHIPTRQVQLGDICIELAPSLFAFYLWFAKRKVSGNGFIAKPGKADQITQYADEYLVCYRALFSNENLMDERISNSLKKGMESEFFETKLSKVRGAFKKKLGVTDSHPILIQRNGKRGSLVYQIGWPGEKILIKD